MIWQKPLQFFETCIPYCIRANMKIPYLLFNSIDYNIDNLVHMNVKERSAKTKLSEIQYTSWTKYICTWAPIFIVTLEMGRMNFCACIQINHETQVMISLSHSFCALVPLNLPHFNVLGQVLYLKYCHPFQDIILPVNLLHWLFLQKEPVLSYISFFIDIQFSYFPNAKYFLVKINAKGLGNNFLARRKIT